MGAGNTTAWPSAEPRDPLPRQRRHYVAAIRAELPSQAFERSPSRLAAVVVHVLLVAVCVALQPRAGVAAAVLLFLLEGHSLACLGFLAHDINHGSVLRNGTARRALETLLFGLNLVPRTLWVVLHSLHHQHAATPSDPDRPFTRGERRPLARLYTLLFFPCRGKPVPLQSLSLLNFVPYFARGFATGCFGPLVRIAPSMPVLSCRERRAVLAEAGCNLALQAGILAACGGDPLAYLLAGPLPVLVSSSVTMSYILTNHLLRPLQPVADPLLGTTSLAVPPLADELHGNFSHHVEHHLFPSMSPRFYPEVRKVLTRRFPEKYHCPSWREAWAELCTRDPFPSAP